MRQRRDKAERPPVSTTFDEAGGAAGAIVDSCNVNCSASAPAPSTGQILSSRLRDVAERHHLY